MERPEHKRLRASLPSTSKSIDCALGSGLAGFAPVLHYDLMKSITVFFSLRGTFVRSRPEFVIVFLVLALESAPMGPFRHICSSSLEHFREFLEQLRREAELQLHVLSRAYSSLLRCMVQTFCLDLTLEGSPVSGRLAQRLHPALSLLWHGQ